MGRPGSFRGIERDKAGSPMKINDLHQVRGNEELHRSMNHPRPSIWG